MQGTPTVPPQSGALAATRAAWACFLVCLLLFIWRSAPGVGFEDSGELAAATVCLGVPHPPGFPLQMLLGHAWWRGLSPLIEDPARALNLFSAFSAAGAAALLALLAARLGARFGAALTAGLLLALAPTFAAQAVITEVYALATLLQAALLVSCLTPRPARPGRAAILFGLALCAHPSSLALAPLPILALLRAVREHPHRRTRSLLHSIGGLGLGLSPYLYVPLAASRDALVNWGNPTGGARLADHLLRAQYATGLGRAWHNQLSLLVEQLAGQWPLLFGILCAVLILFRRNLPGATLKQLLVVIPFAAAVLFYAVNWPLADQLSRTRVAGSYTPLVLLVSALCGLSLLTLDRALANKLSAPVRTVAFPAIAILLALPIGPRTFAGKVNQRDRHWANSYARDVLAACPRDSVLVVSKLGFEDDLYFPLLYHQVARGARPDVLVLSRGFLAHAWFREQLGQREPWLSPALERLSLRLTRAEDQNSDPRSIRILTASFFPDLYSLAISEPNWRPIAFVAKPGERMLGDRALRAGKALWHLAGGAITNADIDRESGAFDWLPNSASDPVLEVIESLVSKRDRFRMQER